MAKAKFIKILRSFNVGDKTLGDVSDEYKNKIDHKANDIIIKNIDKRYEKTIKKENAKYANEAKHTIADELIHEFNCAKILFTCEVNKIKVISDSLSVSKENAKNSMTLKGVNEAQVSVDSILKSITSSGTANQIAEKIIEDLMKGYQSRLATAEDTNTQYSPRDKLMDILKEVETVFEQDTSKILTIIQENKNLNVFNIDDKNQDFTGNFDIFSIDSNTQHSQDSREITGLDSTINSEIDSV